MWVVPNPPRDSLRHTFEEAADSYDAARPRYPQQLFDDLVDLAGLHKRASLLEIGCGTGIATLPLALRGFSIQALEIGPNLASKAAEKLSIFPNVNVIVTPFERWEPRARDFALVYAATSWHWLDPQIRYRKAAEVLKPGGSLALFSAMHAFPKDTDPFFYEIQQVYEAIGENREEEEWPPPLPEQVPDQSAEIEASGRFGDAHVRRFLWEQRYTASEYISLLSTFSNHIAMDPQKRDILFTEVERRINARPDKQVRRHWLAILHVAQRR
jgi:SAM-dependent methyltransferase